MELSVTLIVAVGVCFFVAGMVKGVTGMGLPTVVMCSLVMVMPGAKAAALLVVPSLITNLWQVFIGPGFSSVMRRLLTMQLGVVAGTFIGIGHLTGRPSMLGNGVMGLVLAVYAFLALRSVRFHVPERWERLLSPVVGLATGMLGGATGLFVVPAVPYIAALDFKSDHLIKALGISFGISTISLAFALYWKGAFSVHAAGASSLALIPAMAGMFLGGRIRVGLRPESFKRWFLLAVLLVGISMILRAVWMGFRG